MDLIESPTLGVETGDRVREPRARIHRAGVIQVRPILEKFVPRREVAIVEDGTELLKKILIADRLRAVEHRQMNEDQPCSVHLRLAGDFLYVEVIFAAIEPIERAGDKSPGDRRERLSKQGPRGTGCSMSTNLPICRTRR
jgi:hypothetical protein